MMARKILGFVCISALMATGVGCAEDVEGQGAADFASQGDEDNTPPGEEPAESSDDVGTVEGGACKATATAPKALNGTEAGAYAAKTTLSCAPVSANVQLQLQFWNGSKWLPAGSATPAWFGAGTVNVNSWWGVRSSCNNIPTKRFPHRIKVTSRTSTTYTASANLCAIDT